MATVSELLSWLLRGCLAETPPPWPDHWTLADGPLLHTLAQHHRVAPYVGWRCASQPPPAEVYAPLQKARHRTRMQHPLALERLLQIEAVFTANKIPYTPLKGPRLSEAVYPEPGLRPSEDLDLLVPRARLREADNALRTLGYRPPVHALPLTMQRCYHFHTGYVHPQTQQFVELHWRPADPDILPRWREDWSSGLRTNPAAEATYLAVHLAKHAWCLQDLTCSACDPLLALHPWSDIRLLWVLDLQRLTSVHALSFDDLLPVAQRAGVVETVLLIGKMLERLNQKANADLPLLHTLAPASKLPSNLLRTMQTQLQSDQAPPPPPWRLRMHTTLGLRPIRYLNALGRGQP